MINLNPERCQSCDKSVRAGHPFVVCQSCNCILHKKCKSGVIESFRDKNYCKICIDKSDIIRYNPFYQPPHLDTNEFSQDEPIEFIESIQTISLILENCHSFSMNQLNTHTKAFSNRHTDTFSTYFLNIDGNSTNFDNFAVQTSALNHKFSVIGLAETNTDSENKDLYQLQNYSSCYQSRYVNKSTN